MKFSYDSMNPHSCIHHHYKTRSLCFEGFNFSMMCLTLTVTLLCHTTSLQTKTTGWEGLNFSMIYFTLAVTQQHVSIYCLFGLYLHPSLSLWQDHCTNGRICSILLAMNILWIIFYFIIFPVCSDQAAWLRLWMMLFLLPVLSLNRHFWRYDDNHVFYPLIVIVSWYPRTYTYFINLTYLSICCLLLMWLSPSLHTRKFKINQFVFRSYNLSLSLSFPLIFSFSLSLSLSLSLFCSMHWFHYLSLLSIIYLITCV